MPRILRGLNTEKHKGQNTHTQTPHASYLFIERLVPWSSCFEKLFTIKYSVFIIQVILYFPDKEKDILLLKYMKTY